ncbi:hypothetical protein [Streptomyces marispadix]|uniref:Uncharacterized protein n=1 Tax=Streptomyces marispadix TaxID=2922868 RepID=A0ABS9SZ59_9ACTN|nr:hypothetical protein [Streptomyces marispadix]MCH6161567.1 hypothetical protein [Streptomyces marispadix]
MTKAEGPGGQEHTWEMHAQASGEGHVYQAGGDQYVNFHVQEASSQSPPPAPLRDALASLCDWLAVVLVIVMIACAGFTVEMYLRFGFSIEFFQTLGMTVAAFALLMLLNRLIAHRTR